MFEYLLSVGKASLRRRQSSRGRLPVKRVRKEFTLSIQANSAATPTAHPTTITPTERERGSGYEEADHSPLVHWRGSMPKLMKKTTLLAWTS